MLMLLLVLHCLIIVTIKIYLVNMEPFLQLQTGLNVYTKMLGLDFSLGEQQQGRYMIVFQPHFLGDLHLYILFHLRVYWIWF